MVQEENPIKTIVHGTFGLYSSQGKNTLWKNLRYTTELCKHVTNLIIPTKNVDNWEVLAFHATSTSPNVGALMVATTTGFLSNNNFKCTSTDPSSLGSSKWYENGYDDGAWDTASTVDPKKHLDLVHPHDIVGAAEWIWSKDAKASEIWCRGVRGTESLV
jgi:hypothetical protein